VRGGLRADLPAGPLKFGSLYDVFPFDNRVLTVTVTGAVLKQALIAEVRSNRRGALGLSGVRVQVRCANGELAADLARPGGEPIRADEELRVTTMESLVQRGLFAPSIRGPVEVPADAPVMRELVEEWLRRHAGPLRADEFLAAPRWEHVGDVAACVK